MSTATLVPVRRISVPLETERGTFAMRLVILTESFLFICLFASYFMLENNKSALENRRTAQAKLRDSHAGRLDREQPGPALGRTAS